MAEKKDEMAVAVVEEIVELRAATVAEANDIVIAKAAAFVADGAPYHPFTLYDPPLANGKVGSTSTVQAQAVERAIRRKGMTALPAGPLAQHVRGA